jgi:hypothetical protein
MSMGVPHAHIREPAESILKCIPEAQQCRVIPGTNMVSTDVDIIRNVFNEWFVIDVTANLGDECSRCKFFGILATEDSRYVKREMEKREGQSMNSGTLISKRGDTANDNTQKWVGIDLGIIWSLNTQLVGPICFYTLDDHGKICHDKPGVSDG